MSSRGLNSRAIKDVLDLLIGPTSAVGSTHEDAERLQNLEVLIDVCDWCLDGIFGEYEKKDDYRASIENSAKRAERYLTTIKDWLGEIIEERKENE